MTTRPRGREERRRLLDEQEARAIASGDPQKIANANATREGWQQFWREQDATAIEQTQPSTATRGKRQLSPDAQRFMSMQPLQRAALKKSSNPAEYAEYERLRAAAKREGAI